MGKGTDGASGGLMVLYRREYLGAKFTALCRDDRRRVYYRIDGDVAEDREGQDRSLAERLSRVDAGELALNLLDESVAAPSTITQPTAHIRRVSETRRATIANGRSVQPQARRRQRGR